MIPPYGRRHRSLPTEGLHCAFAAPRPVAAVLRRLAGVQVADRVLDVRFGPWRVVTPLNNVAGAEVTGPYAAWKALGARLSLADRGLTFGTSPRAGVCIRFHRPVRGLDPLGLLRHPALTVTVEDPAALARRLTPDPRPPDERTSGCTRRVATPASGHPRP